MYANVSIKWLHQQTEIIYYNTNYTFVGGGLATLDSDLNKVVLNLILSAPSLHLFKLCKRKHWMISPQKDNRRLRGKAVTEIAHKHTMKTDKSRCHLAVSWWKYYLYMSKCINHWGMFLETKEAATHRLVSPGAIKHMDGDGWDQGGQLSFVAFSWTTYKTARNRLDFFSIELNFWVKKIYIHLNI